jgi:type 2 lantibiotic biosynthesis protein LanM
VNFEAQWWAPGLALHERHADTLPHRSVTATDAARVRLEQWRAALGAGFAARLAEAGLDELGLLGLLGEPASGLAGRVARPEWVAVIERSVQAARAPGAGAAAPPRRTEWREAFAVPLRPLVADATDKLISAARLSGPDADLSTVAEGFADQLSRALVRIAARTFVLELSEQRDAGLLSGADGAQRFADFIERLAEPSNLMALFTKYPVLARLLGTACLYATTAHAELLARLAADRTALVEALLSGVDPGPVVGIQAGQGDPHEQGRSVAIVRFADGRRVVYRPRDMVAHEKFSALVHRLNEAAPELDLRTVAAVVRDGYGWSEFITYQPMRAADSVDLFYRRQGALLALLYAVHGSDIHCENLIACGDQPVLVDVETLFHPTLPMPGAPTDPALQALARSVHRTALLPFLVVGENGILDMSGLGGDRGTVAPGNVIDWDYPATDQMRLARRPGVYEGAQNRPQWNDLDADPLEHESALLDGFRLGYNAIMRHRKDFTALLESCADLPIRVVVRPTRGYAAMLDEATHPDVLRDALDRDRALDLLWTDAADDPLRWQVSRHEELDLWAGDVPLFTGRAGSRDLWTSHGRRLPDALDKTGLRSALDKVAGMSEVDRLDQEWIISASLATRRPAGGHRSDTPMPGPVAGTAAHPERLLAAACAVGDQIVARSMTERHRVNWLGLELVDDRQWVVYPMGASLTTGYLGVALFLAQLSEVSGIARYAEVARSAIRAVPQLLDTLSGRTDLVAAIGCGGYDGLGGITYGLARLAGLLADSAIWSWTRTAVQLAGTAPDAPGWAGGSAGCLAAMTAVHSELGLGSAARLATVCAERTLQHVSDGGLTSGFASGLAGMGVALARYAATERGDARHERAAQEALRGLTGNPGALGWCAGVAGMATARTWVNADLEPDVQTLANRAVLRDLSLCHGELGIAEALTVIAASGRCPSAAPARRRRAGVVLEAIDRYGPSCGTPGWVATPGLLSGLSGIGYGLLRLGFADRVPSALLLETKKVR